MQKQELEKAAAQHTEAQSEDTIAEEVSSHD